MQIKVKDTRMHRVNYRPTRDNIEQYEDVPVAEAKLVLVECKGDEAALTRKANDKIILFGGYDSERSKFIKPILISETEKCNDKDDWRYDTISKTIQGQGFGDFANKKILALPEHFSPEQLQMIVDGKLKDQDKVLVECMQEEPIPMTYKGVDSRGDYIYYCPKCGHGGSYMGIGQVHCYKSECRLITIKLNSSNHITLHKVEDKMYPLSVVEAAWKAGYCRGGNSSTNPDKHEWFEQNVK